MSDLAALLMQRFAAKNAEDLAVANRRKLDAQIVELMRDPSKDEGSVSAKLGEFKVTTTFGIDRKTDTEKLTICWEALPYEVRKAFRWKAEVVTKEFKMLSREQLEVIAPFVESKPTSPSVKVELV